MASGTVRAVESGWPGDAVGIEHVASDGTHFLAVYGHIVRSVVTGQTVVAGQVIGSVYNDGSNSHLHLGIQPPYSSSDLRGQSACTSGSAVPLYGYTNPVPWLASHQPGQATRDFISATDNGEVYRMVGGSPVYVSNWAAVGGEKPTTPVSRAQINAMPRFPRDGTLVTANGHVYVIAGGAPIYVSNWTAIGGVRDAVQIDQAAIDNADLGSPWHHLRRYPEDGTTISAAGHVYVVAGGAPVYVSAWTHIGGVRNATVIDQAAIANAELGSPWNHLRKYPADGTTISANGHVYVMAGGAPVDVSNWDAIGGRRAATVVDYSALDNADRVSPWNHVHKFPVDGTFIRAGAHVFRMAGGSPQYVSDWSRVGGVRTSTLVDPFTVQHPDGASPLNHMRRYPYDGAVLRAGVAGAFYRVTSGVAQRTPAASSATVVDPSVISLAGRAYPWDHLRRADAVVRALVWTGTAGPNVKSGTLLGDTLRGLGGNDTLRGLGGADRLFGGDGADRSEGGDGADSISGGRGRDVVYGGAGNDLIDVRDGVRDVVYCGVGTDRVNADAIDRLLGCERRTTARV